MNAICKRTKRPTGKDYMETRMLCLPQGLDVYRERDRVFQSQQPVVADYLDYGEEIAASEENAFLSALVRPLVHLLGLHYGPMPEVTAEEMHSSIERAEEIISLDLLAFCEPAELAWCLDEMVTRAAKANVFPLSHDLECARIKMLATLIALECAIGRMHSPEVIR